MKISRVLQIPSIQILLFIYEKGEVRHGDLTTLIASRGTLSLSIKELEEEGLVQRRVVTTTPIKSFYSLTSKGREVAKRLGEIRGYVKEGEQRSFNSFALGFLV